MRLRLLASTALAALAASMLTACGDDSGGSDRFITVYNAQHEELLVEMAPIFEKQTGIEVRLRNGKDFELGNQLVAEGAKTPADVFLTENSPAMSLVETKGLFAPLPTRDPQQDPGAVPAEERRLDRVGRPRDRPRLQRPGRQRSRPAGVDHGSGRSGVEGTHVLLPVGCGLPGDRQRRPAARRARMPPREWLEGLKARTAPSTRATTSS